MGSNITAVSGSFFTCFHTQKADDGCMVFIRYGNGSCGTIVSTGYQDGGPKNLTELTGTKGMISVENDSISIGKNGKWQRIEDYSGEDCMLYIMQKQWRDFLSSIENNTEPPVTGIYARGIMEAAFAAEVSSHYKKEICLPLPKEYEAFIEGLIK
jgi:predicted dehydrogenase